MSSRAKKKQIVNRTQEKQNLEAVASTSIKDISKWDTIYLAVSIVMIVFLFFMLLLAPTLSATFKLSVTGESADTESYAFTVTNLDLLIAPLRGCTSGFRYLLEQAGLTFNSKKTYTETVTLIAKAIGDDSIDKVNDLGNVAFAFGVIEAFFFLAYFVLFILDKSKYKMPLLPLIGSSTFVLASFSNLIFAMSTSIKTLFSSSTVTAGWGNWIILFVSLGVLAINIANYIKYKRDDKNENV